LSARATWATRPFPRLDWLRALAILGVFLFHAVHPFDTLEWHVKNAEKSEMLSLLLAFLFPWGLGFFFLIAGAASVFALRRRTASDYVGERVRRLLLPYVVGWLLLSPLQSYLEDVHKGLWEGSFIAFIPHFFVRAGKEALRFDEGLMPLPLGWSYHLWFLLFLLWFSLLGLPLFTWLKGPRGAAIIQSLAARARRPGSTLLFALPIALLHIALRAASPDEHAWGEFAYYFGFFVAGFVLLSDPGLVAAVRRDLVPALIVGVAGFLLLMASDVIGWAERWMEGPSYSWSYAWMFSLFSIQAWGWALAVFSLGLRLHAFEPPIPPWAASSAMPFFIVHQPVILAVAYVVVGTTLTLPIKLVLVVTLSFLGAAVISALTTRTGATKQLLGVKA
jgi:glucan biosynthesis protein C